MRLACTHQGPSAEVGSSSSTQSFVVATALCTILTCSNKCATADMMVVMATTYVVHAYLLQPFYPCFLFAYLHCCQWGVVHDTAGHCSNYCGCLRIQKV